MPAKSVPVENLTEAQAEIELEVLAGRIEDANKAYYRDDAPTISDADYDALWQRNLAIEARFPELKRSDSPSSRIGSAPQAKFEKIAHAVPMLSLDNAFSDEDVVVFPAS